MESFTIGPMQLTTQVGLISSIVKLLWLRLLLISFLVGAMTLSHSHIASANTSLSWTSPWIVSIAPNCTGYLFPFPDECLGSRGFGDMAPPESIRGTEDEKAIAWMQSGGRVRGTLLVGTINFSRDFSLGAAGAGWNVTMDGLLTGGTLLFNPQSARSTVSVTAEIISPGNATPLLNLSYGDVVQNTSGHQIDRIDQRYEQSLSASRLLPEGNYRITGQLQAFHITTWGAGEFGGADYRWTVGAVATPIPEPSTGLFMLSGLVIGVLAVRRGLGDLK